MTTQEDISVNELYKLLKNYMKRDNEWKVRMETAVKPLTEERINRLLLERYGGYAWKGLIAVIGLLATIGVAIHYMPDILKAFRLR